MSSLQVHLLRYSNDAMQAVTRLDELHEFDAVRANSPVASFAAK